MKKLKVTLFAFIFLSIALSLTPAVVPQVGTYTFHGAVGNEKILVVRTANNASLEIVFGPTYVDVLETCFGTGALMVGAKKKSLVTDVNITGDYKLNLTGYGLGIYDAAFYNTSNWDWTLGSFSETPNIIGFPVVSLFDPTDLTAIVQYFWSYTMDVTIQNGAVYFAQLPTDVAQYLGAIVWETKWENVGNTVVHHAELGDFGILPTSPPTYFSYYHNCTETWTYDSTYGAFIGYKCEANSTVIYEFSIELPTEAAIPGFELSIILGITGITSVGMIYIVMKKKKVN